MLPAPEMAFLSFPCTQGKDNTEQNFSNSDFNLSETMSFWNSLGDWDYTIKYFKYWLLQLLDGFPFLPKLWKKWESCNKPKTFTYSKISLPRGNYSTQFTVSLSRLILNIYLYMNIYKRFRTFYFTSIIVAISFN